VFAQIASAIAASHAQGIFHRDLKPENVLLVHPPRRTTGLPRAARVKLTDFGLATDEGGGQAEGHRGVPFYMAPEVLSEEYDCSADVWSLGVILYLFSSAARPVLGRGRGHLRCDPGRARRLLGAVLGSVSAEAKGLVQCLLTKDPKGRPSARRALSHPWSCATAPAPAPCHALAQALRALAAVRAL